MMDHRRLRVCKKAHELTLRVYKMTARYPREELFLLTRETRRSAVSVPSNIAEGCGRETVPELIRFFTFARGSAQELDYQIELGRDLSFLGARAANEMIAEAQSIGRMINKYQQRARENPMVASDSPPGIAWFFEPEDFVDDYQPPKSNQPYQYT